MEKITSIGLDFDKVLIQFLIPGLTALFPWMVLFMYNFPEEEAFLLAHPSLGISLASILGLIAGLLIENLGGHIEVRLYDKRNTKDDPTFPDIWKKFLQLSYPQEPVGHRYIKNMLLRMKFELSFGIALLIMSGGLLFLDCGHPIALSKCVKAICFYLLPIGLSLYLIFWEAMSTSKVLGQTRKLLVDKYYKDNK